LKGTFVSCEEWISRMGTVRDGVQGEAVISKQLTDVIAAILSGN